MDAYAVFWLAAALLTAIRVSLLGKPLLVAVVAGIFWPTWWWFELMEIWPFRRSAARAMRSARSRARRRPTP